MSQQSINNEIPQIITEEIVREIVKLSNIVSFSNEHKSFLSRLIKKYDSDKILFEESNIPKTLDNINEDVNKTSFTGKELKNIIATHKFNQYNFALLKIFKEMATLCYDLQFNKENNKLIESVDILTIMYVVKFLEENSEETLLQDCENLFYKNSSYSSIFDLKDDSHDNPFLKFFEVLAEENIQFRTESLLDTQKIDNLFFIE